jgi:hypothetical protein
MGTTLGGTGVAVTMAVAVATWPVGVAVGACGVGVLVGGAVVAVGVKVGGSGVGVSAEGTSWARAAGVKATDVNDRSITSSKATMMPNRAEFDRFIKRLSSFGMVQDKDPNNKDERPLNNCRVQQ